MAKVIETSEYTPEIDVIARGDSVGGGPSGVANQPIKQLANRTKWLKAIADEVIAARNSLGSLSLRLSAIVDSIATKVVANATITGTTKTKVTYDAKGLVTSGADATTADIADSLNKRYVTDEEKTAIAHTNRSALDGVSGQNTGDETAETIKTKLGITTLSGANTGDQSSISGNAGTATKLATARAINGVAFDGSSDISISILALPTVTPGNNVVKFNNKIIDDNYADPTVHECKIFKVAAPGRYRVKWKFAKSAIWIGEAYSQVYRNAIPGQSSTGIAVGTQYVTNGMDLIDCEIDVDLVSGDTVGIQTHWGGLGGYVRVTEFSIGIAESVGMLPFLGSP